MTTKRDSLYPPTSIGRAQGASIARTPSREALAVHPLLGDSSANAKYVPYTPRQRTTQAAASPPPPPPPPPPSKPPLASLKAAAQSIGLETTSIGWAMLEKISYEGDTSEEWSDVWNALTKTRATLLLPSGELANEAITPEFVQDHVVLTARDDPAVVALSGLRGHLAHGTLTFRSALHRASRPFSLNALPPLPALPPQSSYPSCAVSAVAAALPLPARATKPPLPPRPGMRGGPPSSARLPIPFAMSLFGQRASTPPPLPPATTPAAPSPDPDTTIDVPALVVDTALNRTDIATAIISALKGEIAVALADQPPWLVERVHAFALPFFPFVRLPAGKKKLQDIGGNPNRVMYAVNAALDKPEELAEKFQAFYAAVENELRRGTADHGDATGQQEPDEAHIRNVLETIEATLCTLLYDRLFMPSTSDDASHNEALSSRVAALNMLDLGLEHLDIDTGDANPAEVDAVVRTCGQTLAQLDLTARSPREKAAVLVSAHKLVVDGLSKIPPICLKTREGDGKNPTGRPSDPAFTAQESREMKSPLLSTTLLSTSPDQLSAIKVPESAPPPTSSPVSGDVLLPILIFSVVKANPARLVSHLLFTQRFRNQCFGGEESYCLINLMAVAEFLENVDLGALGLGDSEKVVSATDLTPIPIAASASVGAAVGTAGVTTDEHLANLRGRVGQGVDAIAGSAKVISGVFDTSFGVLRAFLPGQAQAQAQSQTPAGALARVASGEQGSIAAAGASTASSFGLLRRDAGFSIAGLTAALPGGGSSSGRTRSQSHPEEMGQRELVEVTSASRSASLRSHRGVYDVGYGDDTGDAEEGDREGDGSEETGVEDEAVAIGDENEEGEEAEEESEEEEEAEEGEGEGEAPDTRSIKSFESMLSSGRRTRKATSGTQFGAGAGTLSGSAVSASASTRRRKRLTDLTDRLTHGMAGMSRRVVPGAGDRDAQKPMMLSARGMIPPPNRRFVECTEQDIRVSEVGELLREYQRLVEAVHSAGGFQE